MHFAFVLLASLCVMLLIVAHHLLLSAETALADQQAPRGHPAPRRAARSLTLRRYAHTWTGTGDDPSDRARATARGRFSFRVAGRRPAGRSVGGAPHVRVSGGHVRRRRGQRRA